MFTVRILGSSSATPAFSRYTSSQVLNYNDRYYLIDCGEGTQMQLQRFKIKYSRIDALFISHLHGDHILGAPGLLSSLSIFERNSPLPVYAPAGLKEILEIIFRYSDTVLKYPLEFHALEDFAPGEVIFETDRMAVRSIPLVHRTFCRGFLFSEKNKRRKFNFYKAKELGIPKEYFHLIKQEQDITLKDGTFIPADDVLFPREEPLSYAYCSDTTPNDEMFEFLDKVSLLYHESTFMSNLKARALETHHSTAKDAGQAALRANAQKLIIGHFSARYRDLEPLLIEAKAEFENTELAVEGRVFDLRKDA
ncbi:MAG TPA: ribonuclease Z [Bacteroidetes bacterium]|nr:ribonuclease Z [Bacteroidota bacterium]